MGRIDSLSGAKRHRANRSSGRNDPDSIGSVTSRNVTIVLIGSVTSRNVTIVLIGSVTSRNVTIVFSVIKKS